ncbi:hypothetical protein V1477_009010 [Vespula maculifrons]|uniref:Uncharacterized protein n=1 Tax=Vespula maculifrons TaxID=7453 RepID=A0ABD2CEQ2_VESMC
MGFRAVYTSTTLVKVNVTENELTYTRSGGGGGGGGIDNKSLRSDTTVEERDALYFSGWLTGWMACWLVGWLVGWLAGWVAGWLAGWLHSKLRIARRFQEKERSVDFESVFVLARHSTRLIYFSYPNGTFNFDLGRILCPGVGDIPFSTSTNISMANNNYEEPFKILLRYSTKRRLNVLRNKRFLMARILQTRAAGDAV